MQVLNPVSPLLLSHKLATFGKVVIAEGLRFGLVWVFSSPVWVGIASLSAQDC
jgi:hypothetical protein